MAVMASANVAREVILMPERTLQGVSFDGNQTCSCRYSLCFKLIW